MSFVLSLSAAIVLVLGLTEPSAVHAEGNLAEAYAIIASKQRVDLSHAFGPDTPVWHGFGQATMAAAADPDSHRPYTIEEHGFRTTYYAMVGQYGTHIDPPAHFDAKGMTMAHSSCADAAAAGRIRHHATAGQGTQPCLKRGGHRSLGKSPWADTQSGLRRLAHRHGPRFRQPS